MQKFLSILPILLAPLLRAAEPLPNQTYFADPLRSIFAGGTFNPADNSAPKGWSDLSAFTTHNASLVGNVSDPNGAFLQLQNSDAAKSVHIQTLLPLDPEWHWIAASAVLFAKNLKPADSPDGFAGLDLTILDKNKTVIAQAAQLSPLVSGKYTGQKAKLATFELPPDAAFLQITPTLTQTTGTLYIAHIIIMPADPDKEPDPSKVVALHKFIKAGNVDAVQKLLADKRLLECRNNDYDAGTPLIGAAWEGKEQIIQALLDRGVDPQATDQNYHSTATYWAAYWGHPAALKILLPLTKDKNQDLQQAVTVGRSRNHKNTSDADFQSCLDLLNNPNMTFPAPSTPP